jgi:acyl carrier protein
MKTREEIITEINARMAEEFEIDESKIQPEGTIFDTLELDSISLIDLVSIVHVNFGIKIEKEELPGIKTFADLYDYIEQHQQ